MLFGIQSKIFQQGWQKKTIEIFNHFRTLSEKFSTFCQKNWSRAARTAFYVFTGTFWKIFFRESSPKILFLFSDTERKNFGFLSFVSNGVDNSVFYVSIGTLRWKIFSKKILFFHFFCGLWQEKIRSSGKFLSAGLEKLHFTSLSRYILRSIFWKRIFFSVTFGQRA